MTFDQVVGSLLDLADQYPQQMQEKIMQTRDGNSKKMAGTYGLRPLVDQPSTTTATDDNTMIIPTTITTKKAKTAGVFTTNGQP
jgi:hypothetical protein